jgi:hypothetical protein
MPTVQAPASPRSDRLITIAVCIFLTAIIWIVFGQTLGHDFVNFDDDRYVYENTQVSRGLTLDGFKWLLTHSHASLWHPLTTLSHMADCQIYGLKAGGHHFTNVGCVDCRAQGCAQWHFLHADARRVSALHAEAIGWTVRNDVDLSGVRIDVEGDVRGRAGRAFVVGLLAVATRE